MTPELTTLVCVALVAGVAWDVARRVLAGVRVKEHAAIMMHVNEMFDRAGSMAMTKIDALSERFIAKHAEYMHDLALERALRSDLEGRTQHAEANLRGDMNDLAHAFSVRCDTNRDALTIENAARRNIEGRLEEHDKVHTAMIAEWQSVLVELNRRLDKVVEEAKSQVAGTLALNEEGKSKWR